MHPLSVFDQRTGVDEPLPTGYALVWLLAGMDPSVDDQRGVPLERFVTEFALEVLLIRMDQCVAVQTVLVDESFQTNIALIGWRIQMLRFVIFEGEFFLELLTAVRTDV